MATMTITELQELRSEVARPAAARPAEESLSSTRSAQNSHDLRTDIDQGLTINRQLTATSAQRSSNIKTFIVVFQLCVINFLGSFTSGLINVGLPTIATSLALPRSLYLWPTSVYGLTSGATLLLAGSIADLIGARVVDLLGCVLLSVFALACGLSKTGVQLVIFRAFQGVGLSMHLASSVALVAAAVPQGRSRNVSFGCIGLSQPLGFSAGLVISGVMIERAGWRSGFYLAGAALVVATIAAMWSLPKPPPTTQNRDHVPVFVRLWTEIDWVGGIIASAGLALLSYALALLSADLSAIHEAPTATLLAMSLLLLLAFPTWIHYRELRGKPALIPNTLWKKIPFTSTCIMIALSRGVMDAMELFSSLYFQEVQHTSLIYTSLQLLPNFIVGIIINLTVGMFVDKAPARWLVAISSILCAGAPLMMALVDPTWSYWYMEFWAQLLSPMSGDVLFTVGLLIISDEFPEKTQALAGGVFNTVGQFGSSLGITLCQVVSLAVGDQHSGHSAQNLESGTNSDDEALLRGYQASFWSMFALGVGCAFIAVTGLRKVGRVGVKRD